MSARLLARLSAIERVFHQHDRQVERAREADKWRQATESVRERIVAFLRGELPLLEAGEDSVRHERSEVQQRLQEKLQQTGERLRRAMGGVSDGKHKNSFD
jgi:hypothetical protein